MKQNPQPILRVVADINIILNAITAKPNSILWELYQQFKGSEVRFLISQALLNELKLTLGYPKVVALGISSAIAFDIAVDLLLLGEYIAPVKKYDWLNVPDKKDWYLLDLAFEAEADFLISQDKSLLKSCRRLAIPVLHPSDLRKAGVLDT